MASNFNDPQNHLPQHAPPPQDLKQTSTNPATFDSSTGVSTNTSPSRSLASAAQYAFQYPPIQQAMTDGYQQVAARSQTRLQAQSQYSQSSRELPPCTFSNSPPPTISSNPNIATTYPLPATQPSRRNSKRNRRGLTINTLSHNHSLAEAPKFAANKRTRRRPEEIDRIYKCEWNGCDKAYGLLSSLNSHVLMQRHGDKRTPAQYKELRKQQRMRQQQLEEKFQDEIDEARRWAQERACDSANESPPPAPSPSIEPYIPPSAQQSIYFAPSNIEHHTRCTTPVAQMHYIAGPIDLDFGTTNVIGRQPQQAFEYSAASHGDGNFGTDAEDPGNLEPYRITESDGSQLNGSQQEDAFLRTDSSNIEPYSNPEDEEYQLYGGLPVDPALGHELATSPEGRWVAGSLISRDPEDIESYTNPTHAECQQYGAQLEDPIIYQQPATGSENLLPEFSESEQFEYIKLYPYPVHDQSQQQAAGAFMRVDPATEIINNRFFDNIDLFQSPLYNEYRQNVAQPEDTFPAEVQATDTDEKLADFGSWAYVDAVHAATEVGGQYDGNDFASTAAQSHQQRGQDYGDINQNYDHRLPASAPATLTEDIPQNPASGYSTAHEHAQQPHPMFGGLFSATAPGDDNFGINPAVLQNHDEIQVDRLFGYCMHQDKQFCRPQYGTSDGSKNEWSGKTIKTNPSTSADGVHEQNIEQYSYGGQDFNSQPPRVIAAALGTGARTC